jgi:hypothetical protein
VSKTATRVGLRSTYERWTWLFRDQRRRQDAAPTAVFFAMLLAGFAAAVSGFVVIVCLPMALIGSSGAMDALNVAAGMFTVSYWLMRAHQRGKPIAWFVQIGLSILCLAGLPLLTIIHALLLAFLCQRACRGWYGVESVRVATDTFRSPVATGRRYAATTASTATTPVSAVQTSSVGMSSGAAPLPVIQAVGVVNGATVH